MRLGWERKESRAMRGKKLTVYMIDGTEYGPRFGEIGNWVGKAIYSPRTSVGKILSRDEFDNPGIYCLKGDPKDEAFDERVYIGEAENIRSRLKQHLADPKKDFKEFIFFISKDELLSKTQIRYLESRLVQEAVDAKTAEIDNGNSPSIPTMHEADVSDMEYFLEQMKLILPVMGFNFLISSTAKNTANSASSNHIDENRVTLYMKSPTYKATMIETDQGYVVLKGSMAKKKLSPSCTETYRKMRRKLMETNILKESGDELLFVEDAVFNSPSAASNMVLGRNSNGYTEWVDENGKTFKKIQEEQIG
jgi:hypothetical protein